MSKAKPHWKDYALFENAGANRIAMEARAQELGMKLTRADYREMDRIAETRASLFSQLKAAALADDKAEMWRLGRIICGLPPSKMPDPEV